MIFQERKKQSYKKDHVPARFFLEDHLSRTFGKREYGFSYSVRALKSQLVIEEIPITPNSSTGLMA